MKKPENPCEVCHRKPGERKPRCLRCAEKPRDRLLPEPLPGVYLVVDPGKRAGYAIVHATRTAGIIPLEVGEIDTWTTAIEGVIRRARVEGCDALIMESPGLGPSLPPSTVYGLGHAAGAWLWHWRTSPTPEERSVVVEIPGMTWRSTVIGGPQRSTEEWKHDAQKFCKEHWPEYAPFGPESADALCLAEHALSSLDVADAVGVRRLKQLGWVEPRGSWVEGRFVPV